VGAGSYQKPTSNQNPISSNLKPALAKSSPMSSLTKSPFLLIGVLAAILIVVGGAAAFFLMRRNQSQPVVINNTNSASTSNNAGNQSGAQPVAEPKTITYWGLWEQTDQFKTVIADFEKQNPGIKVSYLKQNHVDYRERLQTSINSGSGPDIFRFHASWTPMLAQNLDSMPSSVFSLSQFQQTFFPIASVQLQVNNKIVGVPLMYDGLALYINTEIFRQAALAEPTTWAELKSAAKQLTVLDENGQVERAGLAIGNASNVEHFSDILGLLILQNGGDPNNPTTSQVADALTFYTDFYKKDSVWSDKLPTSTVAFARGEVAMMFAPSWRVHEVKAMNPEFVDFKIIPTPIVGDQKITWGTFWAEGVSSKSANKKEAWDLLKYLSSAEVMRSRYNEQSKTRLFGELYSRKDLADELINSQDSMTKNLVSAYLQDAQYASNWYLNSYTHDSGINDLIIDYYRDAVNAVLRGSSSSEALLTAGRGASQVLTQYGVQ
jgi:multiple sugar transport system substrate-binding protein